MKKYIIFVEEKKVYIVYVLHRVSHIKKNGEQYYIIFEFFLFIK